MRPDLHPQPDLDGPYSWFRLGLCVVAGTILSIGMWGVILILPQVQAEFGVGRGDAALSYTATMLGFAAGNFLLGRYVDRYGIAAVMAAAALALGAGFALAAIAPNIWIFALVQAVIGIATAAGFGPLIADVSHWFRRRRGIAVAAAACGNYAAGAVWPLGLRGIIEDDGWRAAYLVAGIVCVAGVLPLTLFLRRRMPLSAMVAGAPGGPDMPLDSGLSPRALQWILALAGIGCCVAMSMPQVHIVAYCVGLGYGPAVGAEMLSLMLLGGVISRVISGLVADRLGGVMTLLIGSVLQCIALFLYLPWDGMVSLYVISLMFGLAQGGIVPSYALVVREYMPAREAGQRVGFVMMMTILGMALGGWMSGWIYDQTGSYQLAFINGIVWNGLNIAIMAWLLMRSRPRAPKAVAA